MKILIVDDKASRYARLIAKLAENGVNRDSIDIASCANDARDFLEKSNYDLLILDILIPLWPESEASAQHSLDLLLELHESELLLKPRQILGITADRTIAGEALSRFEAATWTVLDYSERHDEWLTRAINCVLYIGKQISHPDRPIHKVDLAIICALERPELEEVLKLPWNWSPSRPIDDFTFVRDGYFEIGQQRISVCATFAPRMGMVSAALSTANLISRLRPKLIAMCGICAGVKGKVNIGDILLADPVWDFQSGKRVRDKENARFSMSPHQIYSSLKVRTHVEQIRGENAALKKIAEDYTGMAFNIPRIIIGPVASGSAVLADGQVIEDIKTQHRELVGVEMEVYGVYAAASNCSEPQPLMFALKGVCDFADPDKNDDAQRYAAYTSANALRLLMEKFGLRLLS